MGFGRKGLASNRILEPASNASSPTHAAARGTANTQSARFDVTPSPWLMLGIGLMFAAATPFVWLKLLSPQGVVINGIIHLGPTGADVFFGAVLLGGIGLSAACFIIFWRSLNERRWIVIDANSITGHAGLLARSTNRISFATVEKIASQKYQDKVVLKITDRAGCKITVMQRHFRNDNEFTRFMAMLMDRMSSQSAGPNH